MSFRAVIAMTVFALLAAASVARGQDLSAAEIAAAVEAVAPSLVRVEYTLRYDKGEEPRAGAWVQGGCPVRGRDTLEAEAAVNEERPLELGAFLVAPNRVVAPDPMIHPRFVESIAVRFRDDLVKARPVAYARDQAAVILELERPLKGARPLAFDPKRKVPYLAVTYEFRDGAWTAAVDGAPTGLLAREPNRRTAPAVMNAAIVDKTGAAVALSMNDEMAADDSWKVSPLAWPAYSAEELAKMLADIQERCTASLLCATLYFRSPRSDTGRSMRSPEEEKNVTETCVPGIRLDGGRLLVLANLRPGQTARLERIVVCCPQPATAKFVASLKDYGCIVAEIKKPAPGTVEFSAGPILEYRGVLLPAAEVRIHGQNRTLYFDHRRIEGFDAGWRRQVYPRLPGDTQGLFLFDPAGAIMALPVARREPLVMDEGHSGAEPILTPAAYLKAAMDDLPKSADPHNVPLSEDEESRLAWLGTELQPLDQDLARENKVSDLTRDGQTGAMVSHVYPDSPAAKAGIEPGWILLRILVEGHPKPLEVRLAHDEMEGPFPWDELDEVSEQLYDRIPTPWPPAESSFTRALTDLGFGTKFTAEFFHGGKTIAKDFAVTPSPATYESAPRYKSQGLGLTVRDLTYEVRRYFQKTPDEPGTIVSKIEPGSKASVAGIKPYEIITHINDKAVKNVKDFEAAIAGQEELRLAVKRMNRGRIVKIAMGAAAPAKEAAPEKPAAK